MTPFTLHPLEARRLTLAQRTQQGLLSLLGLLKQFPRLSEKSAASEAEKREMHRVYAALQRAVTQLARLIPDESVRDSGVLSAPSEDASDTTGYASFDAHSPLA